MKNRRNLLKVLSVAGATGAVEVWKKPVVNAVTLPAHAGTTINASVFLTIDDIIINESDNTAEVCIEITGLTGATIIPFSVDVTTMNGSAQAPVDFLGANQTLIFPLGTANGDLNCFSIGIIEDVFDEGNETFTVSMSNLQNAPFPIDISDSGTVTIVDNDGDG